MATHRYNGHVTHPFGLVSWTCTCGATGAVRYDSVTKAQADYRYHQLAGLAECALCTATTDELFSVDSFGDLCGDCAASINGPDICDLCDIIITTPEGPAWVDHESESFCEDCYVKRLPKPERYFTG